MEQLEKIGFGDLSIEANNNGWKEAVIVFTASSFNEELSERSRSFKVSSSQKFFNSNAGGNSLYGMPIAIEKYDVTELPIRLDQIIYNNVWNVDFCYITKKEDV